MKSGEFTFARSRSFFFTFYFLRGLMEGTVNEELFPRLKIEGQDRNESAISRGNLMSYLLSV